MRANRHIHVNCPLLVASGQSTRQPRFPIPGNEWDLLFKMSSTPQQVSPGAGSSTRPSDASHGDGPSGPELAHRAGGKRAPRRRRGGRGKAAAVNQALVHSVQQLQGQLDGRADAATQHARPPTLMTVQEHVTAAAPDPDNNANAPQQTQDNSRRLGNSPSDSDDSSSESERLPPDQFGIDETSQGSPFTIHGSFSFGPEPIKALGWQLIAKACIATSASVYVLRRIRDCGRWIGALTPRTAATSLPNFPIGKVISVCAIPFFAYVAYRAIDVLFPATRAVNVVVGNMLPIKSTTVPPTAGTSAAKPTISAHLFPVTVTVQRSDIGGGMVDKITSWISQRHPAFRLWVASKLMCRTMVVDYHRVTNAIDEMSGSCKPLYSTALEKCKTAVSVKHLSLMHPVPDLTYSSVTTGSAIYTWLRIMKESGKQPSDVLKVFQDLDDRNFQVRPFSGV